MVVEILSERKEIAMCDNNVEEIREFLEKELDYYIRELREVIDGEDYEGIDMNSDYERAKDFATYLKSIPPD